MSRSRQRHHRLRRLHRRPDRIRSLDCLEQSALRQRNGVALGPVEPSGAAAVGISSSCPHGLPPMLPPYNPDPTAPPNGGVTYNPTGTDEHRSLSLPAELLPVVGGNRGPATSPQLYRILEYVTVPSPFVQTETFVNPDTASTGGRLHNFHPPFNRISKYREPGKINLNTIYSPDVLNGLMNYFPGMLSANLTASELLQQVCLEPRRPRRHTTPFPVQHQLLLSDAVRQSLPVVRRRRHGSPCRRRGWPQKNGGGNRGHAAAIRSPTNSNRPLFQYDSSITTNPSASRPLTISRTATRTSAIRR